MNIKKIFSGKHKDQEPLVKAEFWMNNCYFWRTHAAEWRNELAIANKGLRRLSRRNARLKGMYAELRAIHRQQIAKFMMDLGFPTGHGDTSEALLESLGWQIMELMRERNDLRLEAERLKKERDSRGVMQCQ